jgi:hypothetical protein
MDKFKNVAKSTGRFIVRHKAPVAFIAGVALTLAVTRNELNGAKNFLADKGLTNEYLGIAE